MERIQLRNQYKILAKLYPNDHYEKLIEIVDGGYTLLYGDLEEMSLSSEMSLAECKYVYDVLDMFRFLKISFRELKDKEDLKPEDVQFKGFDGNNESRLLSFTSFLKEHGMWETPLSDVPDDLNTHYPTTSRYKTMLQQWNALPDEQKHYMTAAHIKEVIAR
jgi:uncharacterized protein YfbU (UPF0304 family)